MPQTMAGLLCLCAVSMLASLQCYHCLPTNIPLDPSTTVTPAYYWVPLLSKTMPSAMSVHYSSLGSMALLASCPSVRQAILAAFLAVHEFPMSMINSVFRPRSPQEHQPRYPSIIRDD